MKKDLDSIPRNLGMDFPAEPYKTLAAAIVMEASKEYVQALQFRELPYHNKRELNMCERSIAQCEQFFCSDMFDIFMPNVDGVRFMDKLREKAKGKRVARWTVVR